jgi:threonine/homoserine/homoserine lactone efflux protein
MAFRLGLEFLKPAVPLLGLNAIQWVCLAVLAYYGWRAIRAAQGTLQSGAAEGVLRSLPGASDG